MEFEDDNKKNLGMWLLIKPNVPLILKIKKKLKKEIPREHVSKER